MADDRGVATETAADAVTGTAEGTNRRGGLSPLFTGLLGLFVGLALGAALFAGGDGDVDAAVTADEAGASRAADDADHGEASGQVARSSLGAADAPVVVTLYSDFLCPYCEQHDQEVEPELIERFVDTGQVRLVWHDLPLQGPGAVDLAIGGRAAERQGGFWEYKDVVFAEGADPSRDGIVAAAEQAGLDTERFERDLDDPALELAVRRDREAAQQLGVQGTPAFVVGEQGMVGLQPIEALATAIEEELPDGASS